MKALRRTLLTYSLCCLALTTTGEGTAEAEVFLAEDNGFEVSTDGRANGFLNYTWGDSLPADRDPAHPVVAGAGFAPSQLDSDGKFGFFRVRSGFIANVVGITVKKSVGEATSVRAHTSFWSVIESSKDKAAPNYPDVRETYLKAEGPWGGLLVGRALGLFSRGGVTLDAVYQHSDGLGVNCPQGLEGHGPTCGHVGFGVLFPGFNSQITYNTPVFAGFQLTAGLFDPVPLSGKYDRSPYPRPEAELTFDQKFGELGKGHFFINGMWQPISETAKNAVANHPDDPKTLQTRYAEGFGGGGWAELSMVRLGFAGHYGKGLGYIYALENQNAQINSANDLRTYQGLYGTAGVTVGKLYVNAGVGVTKALPSAADDAEIVKSLTAGSLPQELVTQQMGTSIGVYYHLADSLILAAEYFHAKISFYLGDKQIVDTANAGLTFTW